MITIYMIRFVINCIQGKTSGMREWCFICRRQKIRYELFCLIFIALLQGTPSIFAVPSYARQTGLSCTACHNAFPELNSFGRTFKLSGYTLTSVNTIDDTNGKKE